MKAGSAFNMPYIVYRRKTIAARQKSIQRYPFHVAILEDSIIRDKMTLFLLPVASLKTTADRFHSSFSNLDETRTALSQRYAPAWAEHEYLRYVYVSDQEGKRQKRVIRGISVVALQLVLTHMTITNDNLSNQFHYQGSKCEKIEQLELLEVTIFFINDNIRLDNNISWLFLS